MQKKTKQNASAPTVQLGLAAALGDGSVQKPDVQNIPLEQLYGIPPADQNRYGKDEWESFLQSIHEGGLEQPIIVRAQHPPPKEGRAVGYWIVEGRHRALAFRALKLTEIPAIVRKDYDDKAAAVAEFVTNHQRKAATPLQEARAFQAAIDAGLTRNDVAKRAGVSVGTVDGRLRLLKLPEKLAAKIVGDDDEGLTLEEAGELAALAGNSKIPQEARDRALNAAARANPFDATRAAERALADGKTTAFLDYEWAGDYNLPHDEKFKKALAKVPRVQVGHKTLLLDAEAANKIRDDFRAKHRVKVTGHSRGKGKVDVVQRERNRIDALMLETATRHAKAQISYGEDLTKAVVLQYLKNRSQVIAARQVERAAFEEVTGINKWDGRGSSLASHVEKHWGKVDAGRILHMALFLDSQVRHEYTENPRGTPNTLGQLLLGCTSEKLRAQAKREVAADLKAKPKGKAGKGKSAAAAKAPRAKREQPDVDEDLADQDVDVEEDLEADLEA